MPRLNETIRALCMTILLTSCWMAPCFLAKAEAMGGSFEGGDAYLRKIKQAEVVIKERTDVYLQSQGYHPEELTSEAFLRDDNMREGEAWVVDYWYVPPPPNDFAFKVLHRGDLQVFLDQHGNVTRLIVNKKEASQ